MTEQYSQEPQYETTGNERRPEAPELDLPNRSIEDIYYLIDEQLNIGLDDDGDIRATTDEEVQAYDQLQRELGLLARQHPEHAKAVLERLPRGEANDFIAEMAKELFSVDFDTAMMAVRLLLDRPDGRHLVLKLLRSATSEGLLDTETTLEIIRELTDDIYGLNQQNRELKSQNGNLSRSLGRVASGARFQIVAENLVDNVIVGDNTSVVFIRTEGEYPKTDR